MAAPIGLVEYAVLMIDDRTGVTTMLQRSHNRDEVAAVYRDAQNMRRPAHRRVVMIERPDPGWTIVEGV